MNHFRGGFLHDVSQRTRPFPSSSTPRIVLVELGRRRSESRPSVSIVRDFYTSRPTRGDSARFLRICEFEDLSVEGRSRPCFFFLRKWMITSTCVQRKIIRIIMMLRLVTLRVTTLRIWSTRCCKRFETFFNWSICEILSSNWSIKRFKTFVARLRS